MLTGKWKGRDIVWRHNYIKQLTKILNSEYSTKYATNKNKQITKGTPLKECGDVNGGREKGGRWVGKNDSNERRR